MNAKLAIVTITPKRAAQLLSNLYEAQRNLRTGHVQKLANEMRAGAWRLSPDCICIVKGKLFNGQHRLAAVVESGVSCQFIVMETNDDQIYKIIDSGRPRSVADVIHVEGGDTIAAVARWIIKYDLDLLTPLGDSGDPNGQITRSLAVEFIQQNLPALQDAVAFCKRLYHQCPLVTPTISSAAYYIALRDAKQPLPTQKFFRNLYDGESQDDAARDLRERLVRAKMGTARPPRNMTMALIIKSLRSYLNGTRLGVCRVNETEAFPKLTK